MNNKTKIGLILISLIAISSQAYALSFGSHIKNNEISLYRGQTGKFELSFFSRDEGSVKFILSLEEYPEGFNINYPESFELNSGPSDQYILIENEYVEIKTINVYVEVPTNAEFGEHRILLKASSVNQDGQQGSLGVNAEKTFLLIVNVLGGSPPTGQTIATGENIENEPEETEEKEEDLLIEGYEDTERNETSVISGMSILSNDRIIFLSALVIIVILISYLIYKKSFSSKK